MRVFADRTIKTKTGSIAAVGLAGLLLVATVYGWGMWSQAAFQTRADQAGAAAQTSRELLIALLEMRRTEKDFLLRKDDSLVERHGQYAAKSADALDALKTRLDSMGVHDLGREVGTIRQGVKDYADAFSALIEESRRLGLSQDAGLEGQLRQSVHAIEARLDQTKSVNLSAAMLMLRRHEKDFMLRRVPSYGEALRKGAADFRTVLAASDLPAAARQEIAAKLASYERDFAAWMGGAMKLAETQRRLSAIYAATEPAIETLFREVVKRGQTAVAASVEARAATTRFILASIAGIAAISVLLSWLIGTGIARPILDIRTAMQTLAAGDRNVAIPGMGRRDEIGQMAGALHVFKEGLIEAERLRIEQELAETRAAEQNRAAEAREIALQRAF